MASACVPALPSSSASAAARVAIAVEDHELRAFGGEAPGGGRADRAGAAGHQHDLVLEAPADRAHSLASQ